MREGAATTVAAVVPEATAAARVSIAGATHAVTILAQDPRSVRFECDGLMRTARIAREGAMLYLQLGREEWSITDATFAPSLETASASHGSATAPMPGIVARVSVSVGDEVLRGQTIVVLEAMKMMHEISAGASGRVASVLVSPGQQVGMRALLVEIDSPQTATASTEG